MCLDPSLRLVSVVFERRTAVVAVAAITAGSATTFRSALNMNWSSEITGSLIKNESKVGRGPMGFNCAAAWGVRLSGGVVRIGGWGQSSFVLALYY